MCWCGLLGKTKLQAFTTINSPPKEIFGNQATTKWCPIATQTNPTPGVDGTQTMQNRLDPWHLVCIQTEYPPVILAGNIFWDKINTNQDFAFRKISLVPVQSLTQMPFKCPVMSKLSWINAKPWKPWCHNDPNTFRYAAGAPCLSNNLIRLKLSGSSCWKTSAAKPGKHAWHTKLLSANIPPTQSHTQGMRVTSCSFWKNCCRSRTWNNIKISKSNNQTHRVAIISNAHQKSNRVFLNSLNKKRERKRNFPPIYRSSDSPWLEGSLRQTGDKHMRQGYILVLGTALQGP